MKIEFSNDFHNTAAFVRVASPANDSWRLSPAVVRRVRKALCGVADCKCGGTLHQRGPQYLPDGRMLEIEEDGAGAVTFRAVERW